MQRCCPAREGDRVRRTGLLGYFTFERIDIRPGGGDPIGIERLQKHPPLFGSDIRRGKEDAAHALDPAGLLMPPTSAAPPRTTAVTARSMPRATGTEAIPVRTTMLTTTTIMTSTAMYAPLAATRDQPLATSRS